MNCRGIIGLILQGKDRDNILDAIDYATLNFKKCNTKRDILNIELDLEHKFHLYKTYAKQITFLVGVSQYYNDDCGIEKCDELITMLKNMNGIYSEIDIWIKEFCDEYSITLYV